MTSSSGSARAWAQNVSSCSPPRPHRSSLHDFRWAETQSRPSPQARTEGSTGPDPPCGTGSSCSHAASASASRHCGEVPAPSAAAAGPSASLPLAQVRFCGPLVSFAWVCHWVEAWQEVGWVLDDGVGPSSLCDLVSRSRPHVVWCAAPARPEQDMVSCFQLQHQDRIHLVASPCSTQVQASLVAGWQKMLSRVGPCGDSPSKKTHLTACPDRRLLASSHASDAARHQLASQQQPKAALMAQGRPRASLTCHCCWAMRQT